MGMDLEKGSTVGCVIAWLVIAIFLGTGVTGVSFPMLYGFFISTILVGFCWVVNWFIGGAIDEVFGHKR